MEEENVTLNKKEYDELLESLNKEKEDKKKVVNELIEVRDKKQLAEAEATKLKEELSKNLRPDDGVITPEKIAEITARTVQETLSKKEAEASEENRKEALRIFKSTNKEFHEDNDTGGIKFAALEKELTKFNLNGLKTKEQFINVLESAKKLLVTEKAAEEPTKVEDPTPSQDFSNPKAIEEASKNLNSTENKLIEKFLNGDKKKYLELKLKRPEYVEQLLESIH